MKGICEICKEEKELVNHHTSYKDDKTVALCRSCHSKVHTGSFPEYYPVDTRLVSDGVVRKVKIEIDKHAMKILQKIKEEIMAEDISDYTYSGAIRRLNKYRVGTLKPTPAPET